MTRLMRTFGPTLALLVAALVAAGCGARKHHDTIAQQGQEMRVELAETYLQKGAKEAAIPLLRRALAERPEDPRIRVLYGTVLRDLGLYPQAEAQLRHALVLSADYAPALAGLGILYDLQRNSVLARKYHERAVAAAPSHAAYRNNYGFSLFLAGDTDGAIEQLEKALALDPSLSIGYNNLGFAYGRRGELDKAERAFRAVGNQPATLLNMAIVYEEQGDEARADDLRERAYTIAPDLRPDPEMN